MSLDGDVDRPRCGNRWRPGFDGLELVRILMIRGPQIQNSSTYREIGPAYPLVSHRVVLRTVDTRLRIRPIACRVPRPWLQTNWF